jgi:4-hydroxy-tetrahydrodipicolinate reductase
MTKTMQPIRSNELNYWSSVILEKFAKRSKELETTLFQEVKVKAKQAQSAFNKKLKLDSKLENLKKADVAIEFTQPDSAVQNISLCMNAGIPVVVGTTAWLDKLEQVKNICNEKNGAVFHAPNFSIGVNIFFEINKKLAQIMNTQPQYDLMMEEIHHTEKKDAPSGTAIKTAEVILEEWKKKKNWKLDTDATANDSLLITAKREPNVPGTHSVKYFCSVDEIILTHEAKSRKGFAEGAVAAARWIKDKKGIFDMSDLLKF